MLVTEEQIAGHPALVEPPKESRFLDRFLGAIVIAAPLLLYWYTTCPVIYFGDAGELITAAWTGGIAHPPGYPIYVILLAIFLRLPLGFIAPHAEFFQRVAWQANLFSAVLGAAVVWIVYLILLRILKRHWWAFSGALLAAVGKTFWSQTGIAKFYVLNALFVGILVLIALILSETEPGSKRRHDLFKWGSLTWGLSLANHHEMLFFFPLWLAMLKLALERSSAGMAAFALPKRILRDGVLFFILGLTPYLYLPIASSFNPPVNWGHPSNLVNIFKVLTRAEYRSIKAAISVDLITPWDVLKSVSKWTFLQYFPVHLLLAIPGLSILFRRSRQRLVIDATALSVFFMLVTFIFYFGNIDRGSLFFLEVYFIPWYLTLGVLTTIGCATLFTIGALHSRKIHWIAVFGGTILILAFAAITGVINFRKDNMRENIVGYVYSHDVIATLPDRPQKSILITGGDEIFLFWYWQFVEGTDKDFSPIGTDALAIRSSWFRDDLNRLYPDLVLPDPAELEAYTGDERRWRTLDALLRENRQTYRAYMTGWDKSFDPLLTQAPWHRVIDGPILELEHDSGAKISDYPRSGTSEDNYLFLKLLNIDRASLGPYDQQIYDSYASACYNLAAYFSQSGDPKRAARFAALCIQFKPDYSPGKHSLPPQELLAYNLFKAGDLDLAKEKLEELIKSDPANSLYHVYLSEVYAEKKDLVSARREIEIAMKLEPDNPFITGLYRKLLGQDTEPAKPH